MYRDYGKLLADVFYGVYDLDLSPRKHLLATTKDALKRSGLPLLTLIKDGMAAIKAF